MRLMFVYYAFADQGSGLVIQGYSEAARAMGHEVVVYGQPNPNIPLNYSLDIGSADAVIFIFEFTSYINRSGADLGDGRLDYVRLLSRVPRNRRVILDGDGNYNDVLRVQDDYNHNDVDSSRRWSAVCDGITDKICQPTLHPLRANVRSFLFYAYNPAWETPLSSQGKEYSMVYVGHSKFRWQPMSRVLRAVEPVRSQLGPVALVGHGWNSPPPWALSLKIEHTYWSDSSYLKKLGVDVLPAVPFPEVIRWMSKATFNPILLRPTFDSLRLVNPRMFETLAANTIPLFGIDAGHVREIYGEQALELVLGDERPEEKVLDIVRRPDHYLEIVHGIRRHLAEKHSHAARLLELIKIVES